MATRTAVVTNGGNQNTADLADKNKRLAYNMYRGMLTQFYPQANAIIEALPHDQVTYDQGVDRHILEMIQQSNQISGGAKRGSNMSDGAMGGGPGVPPPPPPPPPPMPGPGAPKAARPRPAASLEPPAAIQVAMMGQSKDKKPFTYTPGGIDLSQIKSPRMARRICRNAANEGVSGPPPQAQTNGQQGPPPPPMMPPQVAVQVLPPPPPAMPQSNHRPPPSPQQMRPPLPPPSPQQVRPPPPPQQQQVRPPPPPQQSAPPRPLAEVIKASLPPQSPPSPQPQMQQRPPPMPQVVRAAPTPPPPPPHSAPQTPQYMAPQSPQYNMAPQTPQSPVPQQMRMEPVRASPTPTHMHQPPPGTLYIPVVMQQQQQQQMQQQQQQMQQQHQMQQQQHQMQQQQQQMQQQHQMQQQQHQMQHPPQPQVPPAASLMLNRTTQQQSMPWMNSASQSPQSPVPMWSPPVQAPVTRVIPIQVEGRNSPLNAASQASSKQQGGGNVRVIPIQMEGRSPASPPVANPGVQSPRAGGGHGWASPGPDNPTQSRSFRVLQRITSYDEIEGEPQAAPVTQTGPPPPAPIQQMKKLQLSNEDRALMDRFKAQVDVDSSLHSEADPRYRGAAIPSRAFKMLQTMTGPDGNGAPSNEEYVQVQRVPVQQARVTSELYVPPSEQTAQPEPRKYTGSAIPSRSFKMLQAMTGTNPDENGLAYSEVPAEAMYYPNQSPCPSPYSWYYPPEGSSGDPVWDSYMYAYYQTYGQYPPGYYYPGGYESAEEFSGYSSTEEMGYYDPNQAYYAAQQESQDESENQAASTTDQDQNSSEESEDSETEVEESDEEENVEPKRSSSGAIQAIKSVTDVRVIGNEEDESEIDEEEEPKNQQEPTCPLGSKQLSIIYEESDVSDVESVRRMRGGWKSNKSCTETESSDGETEDEYPNTSAKEEDEDESTEEESDEKETTRRSVSPSESRTTVVKVESEEEEEEESEEEEEEEEEVEQKKPVVVATAEESEEEEEEDEEEEEEEKPEERETVQIAKPRREEEEEESSDEECDRRLKTSSTVVEISKADSMEMKQESESEEEDSDDEANATVTVRLPLRIKISPSSTNCGPVATLTVGNSEQVQSTEAKSAAKVEEWMQRSESNASIGSSPEVSICLSLPLKRNPAPPPENEDSHWEDDSSSTSIQTVRHRRNSSVHSIATTYQLSTPPVDSDREEYETPAVQPAPQEEPAAPKIPPEKPKRSGTSACEKKSKRNKRRSSTEDDSGVTDLSRQISDSESEVGLDLMLACQRAATHSRLFKLLQDAGVCSDDEEDDDAEESGSDQQTEPQDVVIVPVTKPDAKPKRDTLRLPLQAEICDSSSLSSSEITSPASPTVAAKLVRELAKELSKKKGKKSKTNRIHATALRIMKEDDNDPYDTGTTGSSASSDSGGARPSPLQTQQPPPMMPQYYPAYPPHMYGPHYYDYVDYYNSWGMMDPREYAAIPARAYRVLSQPNASPMDAQFAKCPRIRPFVQSPLMVPNQPSPTPNSQNSAS